MSHKTSNILKLLEVFNVYSSKIAITDTVNNRKVSYADLLKLSINTSYKIKKKYNLKSGDRVIIKLQNSLEFLVLILSCLLAGLIAVPIDPNLPSEREKYIYNLIKPNAIIDNINLNTKNLKNIKFVTPKIRPFLVLFTSGTTGDPKGIVLENEKYIASAFSYSKICEYDNNSKVYHCLPMFYNAGLSNIFFAGLISGANIIIGPKINTLNLITHVENLIKHKINSVHFTPEILNSICKLYENRKFDKEKFRNIQVITTASYLHEETRNKYEKLFGIRVLNCYGITEAGGPLTLQKWEDTFYEDSVGQHSKELIFKIDNKQKINHILIKSPYMMMGYLSEKRQIEKTKLKKGYFDTGDIGHYTGDQLFITGRRQDIIKKGGEIISLNLLDNICKKIKDIEDCTNLNIDDINKGNRIFLFVKFKHVENLDKEINKLMFKLKKKLKKIELPDRIYPVPLIPKLFNGKINKNKLKEIYL